MPDPTVTVHPFGDEPRLLTERGDVVLRFELHASGDDAPAAREVELQALKVCRAYHDGAWRIDFDVEPHVLTNPDPDDGRLTAGFTVAVTAHLASPEEVGPILTQELTDLVLNAFDELDKDEPDEALVQHARATLVRTFTGGTTAAELWRRGGRPS